MNALLDIAGDLKGYEITFYIDRKYLSPCLVDEKYEIDLDAITADGIDKFIRMEETTVLSSIEFARAKKGAPNSLHVKITNPFHGLKYYRFESQVPTEYTYTFSVLGWLAFAGVQAWLKFTKFLTSKG